MTTRVLPLLKGAHEFRVVHPPESTSRVDTPCDYRHANLMRNKPSILQIGSPRMLYFSRQAPVSTAHGLIETKLGKTHVELFE